MALHHHKLIEENSAQTWAIIQDLKFHEQLFIDRKSWIFSVTLHLAISWFSQHSRRLESCDLGMQANGRTIQSPAHEQRARKTRQRHETRHGLPAEQTRGLCATRTLQNNLWAVEHQEAENELTDLFCTDNFLLLFRGRWKREEIGICSTKGTPQSFSKTDTGRPESSGSCVTRRQACLFLNLHSFYSPFPLRAVVILSIPRVIWYDWENIRLMCAAEQFMDSLWSLQWSLIVFNIHCVSHSVALVQSALTHVFCGALTKCVDARVFFALCRYVFVLPSTGRKGFSMESPSQSKKFHAPVERINKLRSVHWSTAGRCWSEVGITGDRVWRWQLPFPAAWGGSESLRPRLRLLSSSSAVCQSDHVWHLLQRGTNIETPDCRILISTPVDIARAEKLLFLLQPRFSNIFWINCGVGVSVESIWKLIHFQFFSCLSGECSVRRSTMSRVRVWCHGTASFWWRHTKLCQRRVTHFRPVGHSPGQDAGRLAKYFHGMTTIVNSWVSGDSNIPVIFRRTDDWSMAQRVQTIPWGKAEKMCAVVSNQWRDTFLPVVQKRIWVISAKYSWSNSAWGKFRLLPAGAEAWCGRALQGLRVVRPRSAAFRPWSQTEREFLRAPGWDQGLLFLNRWQLVVRTSTSVFIQQISSGETLRLSSSNRFNRMKHWSVFPRENLLLCPDLPPRLFCAEVARPVLRQHSKQALEMSLQIDISCWTECCLFCGNCYIYLPWPPPKYCHSHSIATANHIIP